MNLLVEKTPRTWRVMAIGWSLIVLAFLIPIFTAVVGSSDAMQVGYQVGQMAIAFIILLFVSPVALRYVSPLSQSYGRIVTGALLTLWAVASAGQQISHTNSQKEFLIGVQKMQVRHSARLIELGKRFDAIALNTILTPASITSEAGITAGHNTIMQYRALLTERKALLASIFAESEQFFNKHSPTEADKREALASMERGKVATTKLYDDLDDVQSDVAQAISDVFVWSISQRGTLSSKDGKLIFTSAQQQTELQTLLSKLSVVETKQQEVLKRAAVAQQQADQSMRESNEQLQRLLK